MNKKKTIGYFLYAIGIIGGVESASRVLGNLSIPSAVIALALIAVASYLLQE